MLTLSLKMPIGEALAVAAIGIMTVVIILAVIACLIILVSKIIRALESAFQKKAPAAASQEIPSAATVPMPSGMNQGDIELIDTDEKTAAVIMAIVSEKSGIPLNRLSFKSIRLKEDEKKGEK